MCHAFLAAQAAEHEMVHRVKGDFDNVVGNIRALVEGKKKLGTPLPTIGTQFVFYDKNYMSIYNAAKLWKDVGVDYFEVKPVIEGEGSAVNISVFPAKDTEAVEKQMLMAEELADDTYTVYVKGAVCKDFGEKELQKVCCLLWAHDRHEYVVKRRCIHLS